MRHAPLFLLAALLLGAAACQNARSGLTWTGAPAPPSQPRTEATPRTPAARSDALKLIDRVPRRDPNALPDGLTGVNKPGSVALRFRRVVPENTPSLIPRELDGLELFIADPVPEGWLAFYKGDCGTLGDVCAFRAILFGPEGSRRWDLDLNRLVEGDRYIEIQDVRYDDGSLFFNEACATYSAEVDGRCSYLVRLDPVLEEVDWRTQPRVSNNIFILHEGTVLAGYGFTGEPDAVYQIDARTGRILAQADLDSAHQYLEVQENRLIVVTYQSVYTFSL